MSSPASIKGHPLHPVPNRALDFFNNQRFDFQTRIWRPDLE